MAVVRVSSPMRLTGTLTCAALVAANTFGGGAAEPSQIEKGAAIYELRCEACHGKELRTLSGGWSFDLRRSGKDEHERFVGSVTMGKDNMPSWYGILEMDEIEAIWPISAPSTTRATSKRAVPSRQPHFGSTRRPG
jgi:mono/diheme cytochrome c family protein